MYSYKSRIRYSELDESGHLRLESLLDYFQDCSTFQSEDLGLGVNCLKERHLVWVMSFWQIVVERYPNLGETVTIGTAPYDLKGFLGFRNFLMTDEKGNRLACANTIWSLLNTQTGMPVKAPKDMREKYILEPKLDMEYASRKIQIPENMEQQEKVPIRPRHLDTNYHVNNGQFVKIAIDSLKSSGRIKQLRAEYKKQVVLGDVLTPYTMIEKGIKTTVALKDGTEKVCCIVEFQEEGDQIK
ncbi:acyl-[acyl-carrier-protein] thioesterase [Parablautia intestinalis]|uniref:acyl-[acyl-carrier-protein] thioesterase n=1 Tax=Parablautia intestinalis TaxID=2320100 RepID=UPI0023C0BD82|nr:acyl-ACP thioesterase domain-containing protein [Parablautia intestinalis]MDE7046653.1 acyl-[acyl-carrier-protein] thioesterase [Lachnospiraceae bacterium]